MNFGKAIEELKAGKRLTRKGWNGKGMYLFLLTGEDIRKAVKDMPENVVTLPSIAMYTHDATGRKAILVGWLASQSDMLCDDWEIVNE